ncbi:MAG: GerMN domain-containing protein, partial [Actinomycetota bacterium]
MRKLIATLTLAAAAAACSASNTPGAPGAQPPAGSPSNSPRSTPAAPAGKTTVTVYYLVAGATQMYLAPERHEIDKTPAIAKAALDELLRAETQDDDHTVPFAEGAAVNSVVISDKVAT